MMLYLVRYDEIALKSEHVRKKWEEVLIKNIEQAIDCSISRERGRIWVYSEDEKAKEKLRKIFGITSFSPCISCELGNLKHEVTKFAEEVLKDKKSFALRVKRVGKHSFTSIDVARELGEEIINKIPIKVDLKSPEKEIFIEIRENRCYIYDEIISGAGGLPLGVEGKVISLFSGGIDSGVATWLMMKRGCKVMLVHFYINKENYESACLCYEVLKEYNPKLKLIKIEHSDFLRKIDKQNYTCILCKREMLRKAQEMAIEIGAKGIVTGDSLGQVASQTLDNLFVISQAIYYPIYRPLIGMDKREIISLARKIGTYEKYLEAPQLSCPYAPKKPVVKAELDKVLEIEKCLER